ncbi:MAG: hypothetical protein HONBIEJF_01053 [Fimbriimonadaceae bacterium]|nr:hypothetical protein [Fimbriimonadaceae bacterium]
MSHDPTYNPCEDAGYAYASAKSAYETRLDMYLQRMDELRQATANLVDECSAPLAAIDQECYDAIGEELEAMSSAYDAKEELEDAILEYLSSLLDFYNCMVEHPGEGSDVDIIR